MRNRILSFVLTSLLMSLCIPMCAQQPQDSVDALPPGFNRAFYDEKASAEEVIRRNPGAWKINDNGLLEVNGKEVHQMLVNGFFYRRINIGQRQSGAKKETFGVALL